MHEIEHQAIARAVADLGDVVLDPAQWPRLMQQICDAIDGQGAALLGLAERPDDIPRTAAVDEGFRAYFERGYHLTGLRETRGMPALKAGARVLIDQDLVTPEETRSTEYYDFVQGYGCDWFAGVTMWAGSSPWLLVLERNARQGPFEPEDKRPLAWLSPRLSEAATLSRAVGRAALSSTGSLLDVLRHAAVAIGRNGQVLAANVAAEALFDEHIGVRQGRLHVSDPHARTQLLKVLDAIQAAPDADPLDAEPIVVRHDAQPRLIIRALSVPAAARSPFVRARALLLLAPIKPGQARSPGMLKRVFGLTASEASVAALIGSGMSLEVVSERLGITRETARSQLKIIFTKTETHRQAELVALFASLPI